MLMRRGSGFEHVLVKHLQGWEELMLVVESSMAGGRKEVALAAIAVITTVMQAHGTTKAVSRRYHHTHHSTTIYSTTTCCRYDCRAGPLHHQGCLAQVPAHSTVATHLLGHLLSYWGCTCIVHTHPSNARPLAVTLMLT